MNHTEIIEKIRKLLSLSTSDNEHEAAAAVAKAQALLSKYNLEMADIPNLESKSGKAAEKAKTRTRQRLERWAYNLARVTADAFDCDYYHSGDGHTVFIGVGVDHDVCAWTYTYLYRTLLRMGSTYLRTKCRRLRSNRSKKMARESYLRGVVHTINQRLQEQKEQTPITETGLVVVKKSAVADAMPDDVQTKPFKPEKLRDGDLFRGMRDGRSIPLSTPLDATQHMEIK
jgi:hypothetical protein